MHQKVVCQRAARRTLAVVLLSVLFYAGARATPVRLRVCADPDNLPFTGADPRRQGMYLELAEILAERLGAQITYVWWRNFQGKRSIRLTLLAGKCEVYFGLPYVQGFMGKRLLLSQPFFRVGYAIVAPKSSQINHLDDLRGKSVGVQFASPPQNLLASQAGVETVTFRYPVEAMEALRAGHIDVAFIWGPTAGYLNLYQLQNTYDVTPVAGPDLQWQVAIGLPKTETALKANLDRELSQLQHTITRLAMKYGLPVSEPRPLQQGEAPSPPAAVHPTMPAREGKDHALRHDTDAVREGRSLLNQYCAHCHGPNAMSAERRTNLRRLHTRYPGTHDQVFYTTVMNGRPSKGMPRWGGALSEEQIWQIKAFLDSVQTK
jgi:polar amino acid transport system substrate-binding protein